MCHRAELAWRSPLRLSRWRSCLPLLASIGEAPQRCAKAASSCRRSGLSPAVTNNAEAASGPTPRVPTSRGAVSMTKGLRMASISEVSSPRMMAPGQHPQGELGQRDDVALGPGSIGRGPLEQMEHVEASELGPDGLGSGRDQAAHLVERLSPTFASRGP